MERETGKRQWRERLAEDSGERDWQKTVKRETGKRQWRERLAEDSGERDGRRLERLAKNPEERDFVK